MLHGNLLLRGWTLSDVSFYTTELPQYMTVAAVRGLSTDVVPIAAAMTYTLLVLGAALLAKGRAQGAEGAIRALIAVGVMLAPSPGVGASALLDHADHTGTQVPLIAVWLILDRAPRSWRVPIVVTLLLAWTQVADPLVFYEGALPIAGVRLAGTDRCGVCAVSGACQCGWRRWPHDKHGDCSLGAAEGIRGQGRPRRH